MLKHYRRLKPHQLALLREIIAQRCPTLIDRVQSLDTNDLTRTERELIEDALGDELSESGFGEDDEPTQRGLEIEELIGLILRPAIANEKE